MSGLIKQGVNVGANAAFGPVGGAVAGAGLNLLEGGDIVDVVRGGIAGAQTPTKKITPMQSSTPVNPNFGLNFDFGLGDMNNKSLFDTLQGMR